ncbi:MAG: DUF3343 domain-containing protein [Armatimonadetes bacterium]|nr:DUF3343 domain-containing protein [Armatimonadota bacterium]
MTEYGFLLFHTTSMAMRADRTLRKAQLPARLVPTPRQLSSDCGIAIRFELSDEERILGALSESGVEAAQVAHLETPG